MALRAEIVDLAGIDLLKYPAQHRAVREVAVMQRQPFAGEVRIVIEVIDAIGVEQACPADQTVHLVALGEQKLGQVRAILPGNTGDQGAFCHCLKTYHKIRRSRKPEHESCLLWRMRKSGAIRGNSARWRARREA